MLYHYHGATVSRHFAIAKSASNTLFSVIKKWERCKVFPHFGGFGSNRFLYGVRSVSLIMNAQRRIHKCIL